MRTNIAIIIIVIVLAAAGIYAYTGTKSPDTDTLSGKRVGDVIGESATGDMKTATFSGKLEEVNTACFADGECYVVVDGKHVTTTIGWSRDTVGSIQGVEGFGDLEGYIGQEVEVYAQDKGNGTYTLYGDESFYVRLVGAEGKK